MRAFYRFSKQSCRSKRICSVRVIRLLCYSPQTLVGVCDLRVLAERAALSGVFVFLDLHMLFSECVCWAVCVCFAGFVYFEFRSDSVFCVLFERSVLVEDLFWSVQVRCRVCATLLLHIFVWVCVFRSIRVDLLSGDCETRVKSVVCRLFVCSVCRRFETCMFCAVCVFSCVDVLSGLHVSLCCCVCMFFLACVFLCVLGFVSVFCRACECVFFDLRLCGHLCEWMCAARCLSLNSLRERKRTLRTRRSSHHGIPSLMSYTTKTVSSHLVPHSLGHQHNFYFICLLKRFDVTGTSEMFNEPSWNLKHTWPVGNILPTVTSLTSLKLSYVGIYLNTLFNSVLFI